MACRGGRAVYDLASSGGRGRRPVHDFSSPGFCGRPAPLNLGRQENADFFAPAIEAPDYLIVPSFSLLEVFTWVLRERGEDAALQAVALTQQGTVVDLGVALATRAAKLGLEHRLPLADSVILTTARAYDPILWTQDADFAAVDGVEYQPRPRA